ncbi:MAG: hypothetical protein ACREOG_10100 [Gemmatimonadaceae bacterium]
MLLAAAPLLLAGCEDSTQPVELPSRPLSPPPAVPLPPPVQAAPGFPALTRAGEIYMGAEDIYDFFASYHGGKLVSRFVFYADSTFGLQFSSLRFGFFEYGGRFTRADSIISFDWDGWSSAGKWGATGTLRGDELSVKYNIIMALTDFIDGVYLRVRATP